MTHQNSAANNTTELLDIHRQSTKDALRRFGLSQLRWPALLAELVRCRAAGESTSDVLAAVKRSERGLDRAEKLELQRGLYNALKAKVPA